MTLLQLRSIVKVVACGFNVSRAAEVLHTSQPSVSKTIRALENELGEEIFLRTRARIVGLTDL
ncbi:MAG: LysR family transcriptional regulator, partial [Ktedonobacteraceae bacterium]